MRKSLALSVALALIVAALAVAGGTEEGSASTTATMSTGKYNEAPMLAELVAVGELPPVDVTAAGRPQGERGGRGDRSRHHQRLRHNMDSWNDMTEVIELVPARYHRGLPARGRQEPMRE